MGIGNRVAMIAVLASVGWTPTRAAAVDIPTSAPPIIQIGSAYIAKQMCSCLFVAKRSETSCRPEFKAQGISAFTLTVDRSLLPASATVTATLDQISALARYSRRYGCTIVK